MMDKNRKKEFALKLYDNKPAWCLILVILATVLSFFPILVLKEGGSWTMFSLLPLWLITYFFGFTTGMLVSFIFHACKVVTTYLTEGAMIIGPEVYLLEYVIACTFFSLGGLLPQNIRCSRYIKRIRELRRHKKAKDAALKDSETALPTQIIGDIEKENSAFGLIAGYLIGVFVMFICYIIAAPYYEAYPSYAVTRLDRLIYDIKSDGSYLLGEAVMTMLVLAIPKVREIINKGKHIANNPWEDPSVNRF